MVHGYKYKPGSEHHCPHAKIFGDTADDWPAQLQFGTDTPDEGLGIALGWDARGTLRKVHRRATDTGKRLATIVKLLRRHTPHRPVHIVAHSLGAELALSALAHLPRGAVDRMVLLTGASYSRRASDMLQTPAGRSVEVLNITSRENDLFDAAFERLVPAPAPGDRAIGLGIDAGNVTNIQLDCAQTLLGFDRMGFKVAAPSRRICHWSAYTRPGVMAFYNAFLRDPAMLPQARLAQWLPREAAPRWSRLLPAFTARPRAGRTPDRAPELGLSLSPELLGSRMSYRGGALTGRRKNEPAY
jgi:pimeloyl-ACP methyl ester carboxylesterase